MLARRRDIGGIFGIFTGQRSGQAGADSLGIGDDPGDRLAQHRRNIAADQAAIGLGFGFRSSRLGDLLGQRFVRCQA